MPSNIPNKTALLVSVCFKLSKDVATNYEQMMILKLTDDFKLTDDDF